MKTIFLLASAAMLVTTAPLAAQGNGQGNNKSQGAGKSATHGKSAQARTTRANSNGGIIRASNGRLYALDTRGSCPPGLSKKGNGCRPPGQAKKLYNVGQRYDRNLGSAWSYNQVPEYLRNRYSLSQNDRYYYRSGYLYQVDAKTMLVQRAISAVLR